MLYRRQQTTDQKLTIGQEVGPPKDTDCRVLQIHRFYHVKDFIKTISHEGYNQNHPFEVVLRW